MKGLTTGEMAVAMKEIGMGHTARTTSLDLNDPIRMLDFAELEGEMKGIAARGGMIDLASDWLGEE